MACRIQCSQIGSDSLVARHRDLMGTWSATMGLLPRGLAGRTCWQDVGHCISSAYRTGVFFLALVQLGVSLFCVLWLGLDFRPTSKEKKILCKQEAVTGQRRENRQTPLLGFQLTPPPLVPPPGPHCLDVIESRSVHPCYALGFQTSSFVVPWHMQHSRFPVTLQRGQGEGGSSAQADWCQRTAVLMCAGW